MVTTKREFSRKFGYTRTLGDLDGMAAGGVKLNNTLMAGMGTKGDWFVQLHKHTILIRVAHADGVDTLLVSLCGWPTSTTRDRLNRFLPDGVGVYQRNNRQYLYYPGLNGDRYEMEAGSSNVIRMESRDHGQTWTVPDA